MTSFDPEIHQGIQELLGVFALDAVDESERVEIEAHLELCADCRAEVDRHREVASALAHSAERVPDRLWDRIEVETRPATNLRRLPRRAVSFVAAAAVAATMIGVIAIQANRVAELDRELALAQAETTRLQQSLAEGSFEEVAQLVSNHPQAITITLQGDTGTGTVVLLPDGTGFLLNHTLDKLSPDRTYQLWAVQDGEVISAGILGSDPEVIAFKVDPVTLEGLVITSEEAGGVAVSAQPAVTAWFQEA